MTSPLPGKPEFCEGWACEHVYEADCDSTCHAASPLPTDEDREALADLIEGVGVYVPGSHGHDYINPNRAAEAVLAWMDREGFRRSVVSTPPEERSGRLCERHGKRYRPDSVFSHQEVCSRGCVRVADALEASDSLARRLFAENYALASVVSTHEVRALVDEARRALDQTDRVWAKTSQQERNRSALGETTRALLDALEASAVSAPPTITDDQIAVLAKYANELVKYVEADNLPFDAFHWAKAALRAALGGEA